MLGGFIMMIGIVLLGAVMSRAIDKIKRERPEVFMKYRPLFVVAVVVLFGAGMFFSTIVGGIVNGAGLNVEAVSASLKWVLLAIFAGTLVVAVRGIILSVVHARKNPEQRRTYIKQGVSHLITVIVCVFLIIFFFQ